ncbi:MAG: flagellar export protein FliJ [Selenomonadaceae bacterium]|nr:flagellar export protein FliJ [Selenomonadaceae bacterium]
MKKFRFQLETLLKVTRMQKDRAEVAFAEVSRRLEEERQQLRQYLEEMQQGHKDYDDIIAARRMTVGTLMTYNSFFDWKRRQIEAQQEQIIQTKAEQQKKLRELMEVMNELKSIEQLKEKRRREYIEEMLAEEQKMLDEIGLNLYMRQAD